MARAKSQTTRRQNPTAALPSPAVSVLRLVNGSTGDPSLYLDFPGPNNALLFDAGENHRLSPREVGDIKAVFLTHHHLDHFFGFDRVLRHNMDVAKTIAVFGPEATIPRIQGKLQAYAYHRFPFMQLQFLVHELGPDGLRIARFAAQNDFERVDVSHRRRIPRTLFTQPECRVRWEFSDHTVPCLAYAVDLTGGLRFDPQKAAQGALKPGAWIAEVLAEFGKPPAARRARVTVGTGRFELETLKREYFTRQRRVTIGFLTDTRYRAEGVARYRKLYRGAARLYCDSYYHPDQARQAERYGHLTAGQAGRLATELGVHELFLMHLGGRYAGKYERLIEAARAEHDRVLVDLPIVS